MHLEFIGKVSFLQYHKTSCICAVAASSSGTEKGEILLHTDVPSEALGRRMPWEQRTALLYFFPFIKAKDTLLSNLLPGEKLD